MRGREKKRLTTGQTVNADIEEASHAHPQQGKNDHKNGFHLGAYSEGFYQGSQQGDLSNIDFSPHSELYFD